MQFTNPYQIPYQYQQQQNDSFVNGLVEANSWVVQRGQTVRLWDRNVQKFYIKSVGENGMPNPIEVYRYEREMPAIPQEEPSAEYITREEFEERIAALMKPQKTSKKKGDDDESDV